MRPIHIVVPADNVRNVEVWVYGIKGFVELPHELALLRGIHIQYKIGPAELSRTPHSADRAPAFINCLLCDVIEEIQMHVLAPVRIRTTFTRFS